MLLFHSLYIFIIITIESYNIIVYSSSYMYRTSWLFNLLGSRFHVCNIRVLMCVRVCDCALCEHIYAHPFLHIFIEICRTCLNAD